MRFTLLVSFLVLLTWASAQQTGQNTKNLNTFCQWKSMEYGFPTLSDRQYAIDNKLWVKNAGILIDAAVQYLKFSRVFVTTPRFVSGVPYTLATVSRERTSNGPVLYPYPSYEWNNKSNPQCRGIVSAVRVAIDECNRLWVIDSGLDVDVQICPPQVVIFDLDTDTFVRRYQFTTDVYTPGVSLLSNIIVDVSDPRPFGRCQQAMAYIADLDNSGLIVYSYEFNSAWRVENGWMQPDPAWDTHTIAGESFQLSDGIFALNLTPRNRRGGAGAVERQLFFHALSSDSECKVPLALINNQTIWEENRWAFPNAFQRIGTRGIQSPMEAIDSNGNLFANTYNLTIFAWNIYGPPYTPENFKVVANNETQLQFASGMKVVRNPSSAHEELWVATCRFQKIAAGTLDPNKINFRVMACKIDDLLNDRECGALNIESIFSDSNWE